MRNKKAAIAVVAFIILLVFGHVGSKGTVALGDGGPHPICPPACADR